VNDPIVGIDLGTSNTVVAHADATGAVKVLADESGYKIHPSVVSFHPNGGVVVGAPAKQRKVIDPKNTIFSVKRLIGRTYASPEVQTAKTRMPYELKEGTNEQPMIVTRAGEFAVPEISAIVLDHVKNVAAAKLPSVGRAVVTVPASFNDAQRSATATAGAIAGLTVVRVLNEPTAAALAYGHARNLNEVIAVYDFGGGTFDITILKLADQVYEVLGTAGDTFLGGDDLDERLVDRMVEKFLLENRIDLRSNEVSMMRLRAVAEQTKIELSRRTRAVVRIDEIAYGPNGKPLDLHIEITRDEFVRQVADIIDRTFPVCQEALSLAMLDITGINDIILVGGTTKIPYVRDQVSRFFARAPRTDVNPEDAVAMGAALQATSLERILTRKRPSQAQRIVDEDTQTNPAYETPVDPTGDDLDFGGATSTDPVRKRRITASYEQVGRSDRHGERPVTRGGSIDRIDERTPPPAANTPLGRMTKTGVPGTPPPVRTTSELPVVRPPAPPPARTTGQQPPIVPPARTTAQQPPIAPPARTTGQMPPARPTAQQPSYGEQPQPRTTGQLPPMRDSQPLQARTTGQMPPMRDEQPQPRTTGQMPPMRDSQPLQARTTGQMPPMRDEQPLQARTTGQMPPMRDEQPLQARTTGQMPPVAPPARASQPPARAPDEQPPMRGQQPSPRTTGKQPVVPRGTGEQPALAAQSPRATGKQPVVASPARPSQVPAASPHARTMMVAPDPGALDLEIDDRDSRPGTGVDPGTSRNPAAYAGTIDSQPTLTLESTAGELPAASPDVAPLELEHGPSPTPTSRGFAPMAPEPSPASTARGFPPPAVPTARTIPDSRPSVAPLPEPPPIGMLPQTFPVMPAPVVLDVTPRGLGIATVAGYCEQLIRRNSRVPTEMRRMFTTSRDRQASVRIVVCQGESRKIGDNVVLGDLRLENLPPRPRGETTIEVTFMLDASGILQVRARDAQTGQEQRVSLDLVGAMPQADVGAARDRIQQLRR
jgi:molecular chaperone DnaK